MTRFKRFISLLMLAALLTANIFVVHGTTAHAESPKSTPSGIPFSELERFIDAHVAQYIGNTLAGATIIIMQNGEVLLNRSYGYANTASGVLVDDDTVFEWASVGKLLTWVSVMQLVEHGYLDLNADIRTYLHFSRFTLKKALALGSTFSSQN